MSVSTIVEKVQKLLALSKSNNANEAAAAAAAANRLIDQYRLSEADLEFQGQTEEPLEEDQGYIYESGKVTAWKHALMHTLIKHYGLSHWNDTTYQTGRKVSRYRLVGRKSDITIAKYMFAWLTTECNRLSTLAGKGKGRVFIASYCTGFVNGVSEQLSASRADLEKTATSTAIVAINSRSEAAKAFMYKLHTNLKMSTTCGHAQIHAGAFYQGKEKGKSLHLGQHLGTGGTKLLGK